MYTKELKISKLAARQAGQFLKKEFFKNHRDKTSFKNLKQIVTPADKKSEKIIIKILKKHFPKYYIIAEESQPQLKDAEYFWTVDPIDGTTNFSIHQPVFTVAISLFHKNELVLGIIYAPILDEMYWAIKNRGAYKNNKKIRVSKISNLKESILTYNHGQGQRNKNNIFKIYPHFYKKVHSFQHPYCTSLQLALVAAGHTDGYLVAGAHIWDVAAGIILVREAGGLVTDWQNRPWQKNSNNLLATNAKIHSLCLKELKKIKLS